MAAVNNNSNATSNLAYSYLQSKNKISGLVSGMDIESIMEKLMKAESAQMEKLQQQKDKFEWKRDAYREVNTSLSSFEKKMFDDFGLAKNWNVRSVSNTGAGSVNATASTTATGNLTITEATKANAAQAVSTESRSYTAKSTVADLGLSLTDGKGSLSLGSVGADGKLSNIATIEYSETDTLQSFANKINSSKAGVTALVVDGKFSITANNTGRASDSASDLAVTGDNNGMFSALGFGTAGSADFALASNGLNATAKVNGIELTSSTNKFSVAGYSIELTNNIAAGSSITISSETDKTAVVDKAKAFVDSYNELVKSLNSKTSEKKNIDFKPLTAAQKAEMNADEIVKWEEKAKAGLLKSDSVLRGVVSDLRASIYSTDKDKATLAKIGITTTASYTDGGQLKIDEKKLLEALEKDPDILSKVFTGDNGVVSSMRDTAKAAVATIEKTAGKESMDVSSFSLGKNITTVNTKIEEWKTRLKGIEDRYWKQFSAMENAIQKANSQSSIFSQ
ncbi:flagellar filament capping protein FliD [Kurthia sibirica]|uniref:Flagellar hook-associated protein 2 n=1 Tax=Kurthia sibirica TaxID=202750 RepID=A0A2U3AMP1_9BACL|nr:flagellar filament capping protein FliD [Kurthia sibirica]PWI25808.1 hypothetical protein DEX24_06285 [Kurthia sibirica]GEK33626.1 flagellar hook-associated protein 2 [Kurthia sibirica]